MLKLSSTLVEPRATGMAIARLSGNCGRYTTQTRNDALERITIHHVVL